MKKLLTLAAASVVALGAMAASAMPESGAMRAISLAPEMQKLNKELLTNTDATVARYPSMKQKVWSDTKTKSTWTVDISNPGVTLGVAFNWPDKNGNITHPSIEEMPYYVVTCIVRKSPGQDASTNLESMSVAALYYLIWPSYLKWQQWPEEYTGVIGNDYTPNYDIVSFEDMANVHNNDVFEDVAYCHTFKEVDKVGMYYPWSDSPYEVIDNTTVPTAPNPTAWQIWLLDNSEGGEQSNAYINGQMAQSSFSFGSSTQFTFESWDESSEWLDMNGTLYFNGTIRLSLNYSGKARVTGWSNDNHPLQEFSEIHIFNAGVGSSEISGEMDEFGVPWGPLQKFYAYGCGKYIFLYYGQEMVTDGTKYPANPSAFDLDMLQPTIRDQYSGKIGPDEANNFFGGTLFSAVDYDIEKGGEWKMLSTFTIPGTTVSTVKPTEQSYCAFENGYGEKEGFFFITYGYQDVPVPATTKDLQEGLTYGNYITIGTTQGMQINYFTGMGDYYGEYKGDIIYHYDPEDMTKIRKFSAVGSLEPSASEVAEIEAAEGVAPVYFNLQGVRVANPEKGLFIKVEGNKTSKVIL